MLKIGKWLAVISLVFLLIGTIAYFYAQDDMIEILDPKTTNLVELSPNSSQSVELERMGLYVALRIEGENTLPELKLINNSGKEIDGREAAWYDFDRTGLDGSIYQTVMVFENTKNEEYILYNEGETTLWLIDETSNQIEIMSDSGFIAITCGFCMGIPLAILALITLVIGWRKGANNQKISISDELYIDKERGKIKIVKNIQNIPDPFMENNDLSARETESIENEDTFWEDWDNQK
ncbi:MAG: hypothetical protein CMA42_00670 [Euryarchaeota archaeon]|nr:hypothetical protein [Euryarchaeota archaeon]